MTHRLKDPKETLFTLLCDFTVSGQEDVFHWCVKDEVHILQETLFGERRLSVRSFSTAF